MGNDPSAADMERFMSLSVGARKIQWLMVKIQFHVLMSLKKHGGGDSLPELQHRLVMIITVLT